MIRVANLVKRLGKRLGDINVTLDSHSVMHIAHPLWFKNSKGEHPSPFTVMRLENGSIIGGMTDASGNFHDVGEFTATRANTLKWTLEYLELLASKKKYPHVIWPYHCLIGTPGHNIVQPLSDALIEWEHNKVDLVNKVTKGSCPFVEHFSGVRAEIPHKDYPGTQIDSRFINTIVSADLILVAGEARSHCLANTLRDLAELAGDEFVKKCVLLTDGTSDVPGFSQYGESFVKDMTAMGMQTTTTVDFLA
jgi:nicotinamidase-related amidase